MKKTLLFVLALIAVGCGPPDGPYETYHDNGQLREKGTYKDWEKCGEWIEDGETVTYPPCPPGLADGN